MIDLKAIQERIRNGNQAEAYTWAKKNLYQSVAARYAHILACMVDESEAEVSRLEAELEAAKEDIYTCARLACCEICKNHGSKECEMYADGSCSFEWFRVKGE